MKAEIVQIVYAEFGWSLGVSQESADLVRVDESGLEKGEKVLAKYDEGEYVAVEVNPV
ncbi:hypothetical protein [Halopiger thermotolerans]